MVLDVDTVGWRLLPLCVRLGPWQRSANATTDLSSDLALCGLLLVLFQDRRLVLQLDDGIALGQVLHGVLLNCLDDQADDHHGHALPSSQGLLVAHAFGLVHLLLVGCGAIG